jgi:hypothetical protein
VQLEAASEADERNIIDVFIQELNGMFLADLATEYSVDREQETEGTGEALDGKRLVLVGLSHATRLASAYDDMELEVVDLSMPGWRASPANVATMSAELSKVLAEDFEGETIIIYQLFDNLCYRVCDANGNRSLPVRGEDGKYHLPGKMVIADRDEFRAIFMDILPLLRAGADSVKILMTPLMRYVKKKCCDDPGHITNKGSFGEEIGEGLNEICS